MVTVRSELGSAATKPPVRVLQLGGPAALFGAERWILALSRSFPADEVTTVVGVVNDQRTVSPPLCEHAQRVGITAVSIEAPGKLSLNAISQIRGIVRKDRINVLHTHGYKTDILGVLATRKLQCVHVATPHGWSVKAGVKLSLNEALGRVAFAGCDAIVPLSEGLYRGLNRLPWVRHRLHLISNGVDLSEVDEEVAVAAEIDALAAGTFVIGYIGQLIPRKRVDVLIRAFVELESPRKCLYIVGEGSARRELEGLAMELGASDQVRFTGFREDRLSLLRGFDAFVLASSLEGVPRCLMEAMAMGIPVVASDIEGCRALVEDGETGLMFGLGDHHALAGRLHALMHDQELRLRIGGAGRRKVVDEFSASRMAREYLMLYRNLLDGVRNAKSKSSLTTCTQ